MDKDTVSKIMIDGLLSKGYVIGDLDDDLLIDIRDIIYKACNSVTTDCRETEEEYEVQHLINTTYQVLGKETGTVWFQGTMEECNDWAMI